MNRLRGLTGTDKTIKIITNKKASPAASIIYNALCVLNESGEYETLLLTESDLQRMRDRAKKNPEDCISLHWTSRAALWVLRALRLV